MIILVLSFICGAITSQTPLIFRTTRSSYLLKVSAGVYTSSSLHSTFCIPTVRYLTGICTAALFLLLKPVRGLLLKPVRGLLLKPVGGLLLEPVSGLLLKSVRGYITI